MIYARTESGIVTDTLRVEPYTIYPSAYASQFAQCPADVQRGWLFDGSTYTAPVPVPPSAEETRALAKLARAESVAAIKVTTAAGNTFDGDEISQGRMSRAVIALSTGLAPSVSWVLADNTVIQATAAELTEALVLAGMAQAAVWVIN